MIGHYLIARPGDSARTDGQGVRIGIDTRWVRSRQPWTRRDPRSPCAAVHQHRRDNPGQLSERRVSCGFPPWRGPGDVRDTLPTVGLTIADFPKGHSCMEPGNPSPNEPGTDTGTPPPASATTSAAPANGATPSSGDPAT